MGSRRWAGAGPRLAEGSAGHDVTLAEVLALGAAAGVASVGTASLALAQAGRHDGWTALALGAAPVLGLAVLARREGVRVRNPLADLALALLLGALSLFMFLPGAPYAYADKDPGIYVVHALAIARDGDVRLDDPVLEEALPGALFSPGARFPGVWVDGDTDSVTPQFFHFFPALTATAVDVTDTRAAFHLNALLGALAVVVLGLGARRAFSLPAAAITGGLLATSMPQVWQAKYPTTEILAQLLLVASVVALGIAVERRSSAFALTGGLLIGTGFLARPDGLLPVLIAIAAGGLLLALDRFDRTARWCAVGLALTLPYALLNAYDLRRGYTLVNDVPDLPVVAVAAVAAVAGGRALRPVALRLQRRLSDERWHRRLGTGLAVAFGVLLLVLANRERLFGIAYTDLLGPEPRRSYDELNVHRLRLYLGRFVLPLAVVGLAVVGRQRWRLTRWLLLVPGLCLAPLYLWEAQISPRLMWWVRRFVPGVLPLVLLLAAVALAWGLAQRRWIVKASAALVLVVVAVPNLDRSLPLRSHREMAGSYDAARAVAEAPGGDQGLFLWQRPAPDAIFSPTRNLGAVVWLAFDQLSALLPHDPDQPLVDEYASRFGGHPVFVVAEGTTLPAGLDPGSYTAVERVRTELPVWEEQLDHLPMRAVTIGIDVTVWRLDAAAAHQGS